MSEDAARPKLGVDFDEASTTKAAAGIGSVGDEMRKAGKTATKASEETASFTEALSEIHKEAQRSETIDTMTDRYRRFADEIEDVEGAVEGLDKELKNLEATESEISRASKRFAFGGGKKQPKDKVLDIETKTGKAESGIRGLGGAIGVLGGEAGQAAESVFTVAAEIPALVTGIIDVRTASAGISVCPT